MQETCWEKEKSLTIQMQIEVFHLREKKKKKNHREIFFLKAAWEKETAYQTLLKPRSRVSAILPLLCTLLRESECKFAVVPNSSHKFPWKMLELLNERTLDIAKKPTKSTQQKNNSANLCLNST